MKGARRFSKASSVALSILALVFSQPVAGEHHAGLPAQSQSTLNLSGTWELVNENGWKKTASHKRFPIMTLTIVEGASEIRITRKRIRRGKEEVVNYLYYTDGRGETNVGRVGLWPEAPNLESVTRRNEHQIITEYKKMWVMGAAVQMVNSRVEEQWRLGSDGTTLSLAIRAWAASPEGTVSGSSFSRSKLVFRRIS